MSSLSQVTVFRVEKITKHPNADSLDIIDAFGCPVIAKSNQYKEGDLAAYIPVDMVCPDLPEFEFLGKNKRIRAKKLRGIFSMGLLTKPPANSNDGDNVTELLGVSKYEEKTNSSLGKVNEVDPPSGEIKYTDIESLRRYKNVLEVGEKVILSEKIHGANARYVYQDGKLHLGSHRRWLDINDENIWSKAAKDLELEIKLKEIENYIVFGEVYGQVQDLRYGHGKGSSTLAVFDIFDIKNGVYLNWKELTSICIELKLPVVPILYSGEWKGFEEHKSLAEGTSQLADNVREGFVVRPEMERWNREVGRVILKLHGEGYLLRK